MVTLRQSTSVGVKVHRVSCASPRKYDRVLTRATLVSGVAGAMRQTAFVTQPNAGEEA